MRLSKEQQATALRNANRRLRAKNAKFKEATKTQKRVMIAQDVILELESKTFTAKSGEYFDSVGVNKMSWELDSYTTDLRDVMTASKEAAKCTVCALGGVFACAVKFRNNITVDEVSNGDFQEVAHEYLSDIFSEDQLRLIETAFERSDFVGYTCGDDAPSAPVARAMEFGDKYQSDKKRMIAIMQNVIANNGTFKP